MHLQPLLLCLLTHISDAQIAVHIQQVEWNFLLDLQLHQH